MKQLLARIKEKPRAVRVQYAFYGATVVTALIAVVWVLSFSASGGPLATPRADNAPNNHAQEKSAPAFGSLFSQIKEQWASVRSSLKGASSSAATSTEVESNLEATVERSLEQTPTTTERATSTTTPETPVRYGRIGTTSSRHATTTQATE